MVQQAAASEPCFIPGQPFTSKLAYLCFCDAAHILTCLKGTIPVDDPAQRSGEA
jgi:hypothetical protein